jgi:hypothetical protein
VVERRGILPPFPEGRVQVSDRRSPDLELNVVPGGPRSVPPIKNDALRIPFVALVIAAAVAQIDPTDEGNVVDGSGAATDEGELLVVGSEPADPFIGQHLPARLVHDLAEVEILLLRIPFLVRMGPPYQPPHVGAPPDRIGKDVPHLRSRAGQPLIVVAPPVQEPQAVPGTEGAGLFVQSLEVLGAVDENLDGVPLGPASAVPATAVDLGGVVTALARTEEPSVGPPRAGRLSHGGPPCGQRGGRAPMG